MPHTFAGKYIYHNRRCPYYNKCTFYEGSNSKCSSTYKHCYMYYLFEQALELLGRGSEQMPSRERIKAILNTWLTIVEAEQSEMMEIKESWKDRYFQLKGRIQELITELLNTTSQREDSKTFSIRIKKDTTKEDLLKKINKLMDNIKEYKGSEGND